MIRLGSKARASGIGMDFGACSLRAVQLDRIGDHWHVRHWINIETPMGMPGAAPPHSREEIALAFGPGTFVGRRSSGALSPPDVEYQLLEVPPIMLEQSVDRLRTALRIEIDRQMPWPMEEAEVAVWPTRDDASCKVPIVVVAARRQAVQNRLDLLDSQRIVCERVDVVPFAMISLLQAASETKTHPGDQVWGILDLGHTSSRLYIVHGDRPIYTRVLLGGGMEWTETIAKTLHIDAAVAEKYKRAYGIRPTDRGFGSLVGRLAVISENELPSVFYAILRPVLDNLATEIERSYRYAMGQFPGSQAGPLYLIGGGARLGGLTNYLNGHLGVPIRMPDAGPRFMDVESEGPGTAHSLHLPLNFCVLAPCVGLAIKEEAA